MPRFCWVKGNVIKLSCNELKANELAFICVDKNQKNPTQMQLKTKVQIIEELKSFQQQSNAQNILYKDGENSFTRDRCLSFEKTALFIARSPKKSLSVELEEYFSDLGCPKAVCTKSALCQRRKQLKPCLFEDWNQVLVQSYYHYNRNHLKRWKGYRLHAVDGSTAYLMDRPSVVDHFGVQTNQSTAIAMGRVMNCFDVLNGISVRSQISPIVESELGIAIDWVEQIEDDVISIYDRGYGFFAVFFMHLHGFETEKKFVIRCKQNANLRVIEFVASNQRSQIVELKPSRQAIDRLGKLGYRLNKSSMIKIRLLRIELDDGEIEVLATNLMCNKQYPYSCFKKLYFMRWAVETEYDSWKNTNQLEQFSGHSPRVIYQDFYANVLIANLHQMLIADCEKEVKIISAQRKYEYKVNRNVTFGLFKREMANLFSLTDISTKKTLELLKHLFCKYIEPIRPGRSLPRIHKSRRLNGKYLTYTNYKRAV